MKLHFPDTGWERLARDWSDWWAGELERPLVVLECIRPADLRHPYFAGTFLGNYSPHIPTNDLLDLFIPRLEATHYLGDAFPRFWPNYGPGIAAAFAGARPRPAPDTTWFFPPEHANLADLRIAFDEQNEWWLRVEALTRAAVERWRGQLAVGLTDLGGNLDVLAHLRGAQRLLLDFHDAPGEVDRLIGETTRLWLECFDRLCGLVAPTGRGITCWGSLWSGRPGYMLQSDVAYMISPQMFARFVLPDLEACCAVMDFPFYHLDGKGQIPHLDLLLSIPRLRGIQWVPGDGNPPPERWLDLLARIRAAGKLCQVTVSPQGALTIIRELGGKGFCFVISEPQLTPDQGQAFLEFLDVRH